MKKTLMMSVLGGLALGLTACASTPTNTIAIQKENNQYEVTGIGKTNLISKNNAVSAAQKTCTKNTSPVPNILLQTKCLNKKSRCNYIGFFYFRTAY